MIWCISSNSHIQYCIHYTLNICVMCTYLLLFKFNLCLKSLNKTVTQSMRIHDRWLTFQNYPVNLIWLIVHCTWDDSISTNHRDTMPLLYIVYRRPHTACLMPMHRQTLENVTVAKIAIFHLINEINICSASPCLDRSKS